MYLIYCDAVALFTHHHCVTVGQAYTVITPGLSFSCPFCEPTRVSPQCGCGSPSGRVQWIGRI